MEQPQVGTTFFFSFPFLRPYWCSSGLVRSLIVQNIKGKSYDCFILARIPRRKSGLCSSVWAENLASMWFLLPIIVVFGVLTIVPLSQSFFYSLTDYDGWSSTFNFVWFDNYVRVFQDPDLLSALGFTLLYAFATTLLVTCLAIPLAVTLNKAMWGRSFARSLFFFLGVPAQAIIGLIWSYIFSPLSSGLVNKILAILVSQVWDGSQTTTLLAFA